MDQIKIKEIRIKWGERPCKHPELISETHEGEETGSKYCTSCGREIYSGRSREVAQ